MNENDKKLVELLTILHEENILKNIVLVGSWCLHFYQYIFENFEPTVRTTDIDFYVPSAKAIKERNGIIDSLKTINYDVIFDTMTHKTTFISPDGFELEFLTKTDRNKLTTIKLGNTNIYAETISYLDFFAGNYIEVDYYGFVVKVASPASYVLQKLLINDIRGEKKQKDIDSVVNVLFYLYVSRKYCDELEMLFDSLPKKWKKRILSNACLNNIDLFKYK